MNTRILKIGTALGLAVAVAGSGVANAARVYRLRRTVVIGDSILAGFGSGGLVVRGPTGQRFSAPAQFARQAHITMPQPLMSSPGVPPPLHIVDANRNGILDAEEVRRDADSVGFRALPSRGSRNLAVPGEDLNSVFERLDAEDVGRQLIRDDIEGRDILKFLMLGLPLRGSAVSQLTVAKSIEPSFFLVWLGNNDVLTMATSTDPSRFSMPAPAFGTQYRKFLNELADSGVDMAVANLPDVTQIAALRHPGPNNVSCTKENGETEAVDPQSLLSIALSTTQLPVPSCRKILSPAEQASIRATVQAYNTEIAGAVADVQANRGITIALVDMFALFDQVATAGYDVKGDGSLMLTNGYLGGLFSLDGVHPTRTGNSLIANAFIDAINLRFGEAIPRVDVAAVAAKDPLVGSSFRPAGEPPFGLIKNDDIDVADALDNVYDDLSDHTRDIFNRLKNRVRSIFRDLDDVF